MSLFEENGFICELKKKRKESEKQRKRPMKTTQTFERVFPREIVKCCKKSSYVAKSDEEKKVVMKLKQKWIRRCEMY